LIASSNSEEANRHADSGAPPRVRHTVLIRSLEAPARRRATKVVERVKNGAYQAGWEGGALQRLSARGRGYAPEVCVQARVPTKENDEGVDDGIYDVSSNSGLEEGCGLDQDRHHHGRPHRGCDDWRWPHIGANGCRDPSRKAAGDGITFFDSVATEVQEEEDKASLGWSSATRGRRVGRRENGGPRPASS